MYRKIESARYFDNPKNIIFDLRNEHGVGQIRLNDGVFHLKNTDYPKYFRYEEPYDAHFCGEWFEVSKEEYCKYLLQKIEEKYVEIERLKKEYLEIIHGAQ